MDGARLGGEDRRQVHGIHIFFSAEMTVFSVFLGPVSSGQVFFGKTTPTVV
jgi:hypothetical protein